MAVDIIAGLDKIQQSAQAKSGLQVPAGGYQVTVAIIHNGKLFYNGSYMEFESQMQAETLEDEFIRLTEEDK